MDIQEHMVLSVNQAPRFVCVRGERWVHWGHSKIRYMRKGAKQYRWFLFILDYIDFDQEFQKIRAVTKISQTAIFWKSLLSLHQVHFHEKQLKGGFSNAVGTHRMCYESGNAIGFNRYSHFEEQFLYWYCGQHIEVMKKVSGEIVEN